VATFPACHGADAAAGAARLAPEALTRNLRAGGMTAATVTALISAISDPAAPSTAPATTPVPAASAAESGHGDAAMIGLLGGARVSKGGVTLGGLRPQQFCRRSGRMRQGLGYRWMKGVKGKRWVSARHRLIELDGTCAGVEWRVEGVVRLCVPGRARVSMGVFYAVIRGVGPMGPAV
jgi:hypothetical protein